MVETYNTKAKDLAVEDFSQYRNSKGDVELNNHTLANLRKKLNKKTEEKKTFYKLRAC